MSSSIDISSEVRHDLHSLSARELLRYEIHATSKISELEPVVKVGGATFAVRTDISFISGLPKAGKTQLACFIMATALVKGHTFDSLQIETTFHEGRNVCFVDNEQPDGYTKKVILQTLNLLGLPPDKQPDVLKVFNLRQLSAKEKKEVFIEMVKSLDTHLWIVDGIADLMRDPNDLIEASELIQELTKLCTSFNTTMICYIHHNPGTSDKSRGHIGSESERKCGGSISVKKDPKQKHIHVIEAKHLRGGRDFDPIFWTYDQNLGRGVSLDPQQREAAVKSRDKNYLHLQELKQLAVECLKLGRLTPGQLREKIEMAKDVKERAAKTYIQKMSQNGIIERDGDFYSLKNDK